ncbi:hypothetical protein NDU88_004944 [Pleurodeles waltl]|uniref:DNA 3'-5' helicase n=1 Tax=Pleurodeles waltl TaxID=8319 RepID=A0AAV7MYN6_PLEWA|nr:hypothetical protein NDU88_004944 [Pleurodeles waltl]
MAHDRGRSIQDRNGPMSLDITDYELDLLEYEAQEERLKQWTEDALYEPKGPNPPRTDDSEDELDPEMLEALENIDRGEEHLIASQTIPGRRRSPVEGLKDRHLGDDEDESIEEAFEVDWNPSIPEPNAAQIACLKTYFGHSRFKPVQWKVIASVLRERRDNLVVMATGYGKSLCYQFPPVYTGGVGIVISPLISLMEDQVLQLEMSNIPACFLGSAQSKNILADVRSGHYKVVYMTPEFCSSGVSLLLHLNKTVGITLIAVDEAHCISEWGHDFRSSYRSLGSLKISLPSVPILALTATASPSIREDIAQSLKLKNYQVTCTSFDRPNLFLEVGRKTSNIFHDLQPLMIKKKGSTWEFEGPTIIYCPSRKSSEQVTAELTKLNILCGTYHAGMGIKARREVHHRFMRDEIQCVVATVAFGMGINKADIRKVIHYGAPKEMESYYQEIGRAGRDGLPSSCHVFWTLTDMNFNRHMLSEIKSTVFREYKMKMLTKMEKYLNSLNCRRRIILSHFEDKQLRKATSGIMGTDSCCDNCRSRSQNNLTVDNLEESLKDFGKQAYQLMSAISALGERFGSGVPVLFLRGSNSQRLPDKYRCHPLFGSGKDQSENWWKALARLLIGECYLKEASGINKFAVTCGLTKKAHEWMHKAANESHRSLLLLPSEELCPRTFQVSSSPRVPSSVQLTPNMKSSKPSSEVQKGSLWEKFSYQVPNKPSKSNPFQSPSPTLAVPSKPAVSSREMELQTSMYGKLVTVRQRIASEKDIPPAVLATNKILVDMAKIRPTTVENLKKIDGVSEAKASMLSPLLSTIKEFCLLNNLQADVVSGDCGNEEEKSMTSRSPESSQLSESFHITYSLFQEKHLSLKEIASTRGLSISVVGAHLYQALKGGYPVDLNRAGLTSEIQKVITTVIKNPPINSDLSRGKAIRALVPADIELYLIRMVMALLEKGSCTGQGERQSDFSNKLKPDLVEVCQSTSGPSKSTNSKAIENNRLWIETERAVKTSGTQPAQSSQVSVPVSPNPPPSKTASLNLHEFDADTEELFADSQTSSQSSKRKLPGWFESSKGCGVSSVSGKKAKTKRGLFG